MTLDDLVMLLVHVGGWATDSERAKRYGAILGHATAKGVVHVYRSFDLTSFAFSNHYELTDDGLEYARMLGGGSTVATARNTRRWYRGRWYRANDAAVAVAVVGKSPAPKDPVEALHKRIEALEERSAIADQIIESQNVELHEYESALSAARVINHSYRRALLEIEQLDMGVCYGAGGFTTADNYGPGSCAVVATDALNRASEFLQRFEEESNG